MYTQDLTSTSQKYVHDGMSHIRLSFKGSDISDRPVDAIIHLWRPATHKHYNLHCIEDVAEWISDSMLKMNNDKTELIAIGTKPKINQQGPGIVNVTNETMILRGDRSVIQIAQILITLFETKNIPASRMERSQDNTAQERRQT